MLPPRTTTYAAIVGQVIATERTRRGITQGALAAAVGVGQATWSKVEHGRSALSVGQLRRAASALRVRPHAIVAEADAVAQSLGARGVVVLDDFAEVRSSELDAVDAGLAFIGGAALAAIVGALLARRDDEDE